MEENFAYYDRAPSREPVDVNRSDYPYSGEIALYFDRRELKPFAEPVSSTQLQEGAVYFAVNYVDDEMLIPVIETLVFVGRNLEPGDVEKVYFQDVESYREGVRYGSDSEEEWAKFETGSENEIGHIFDYERA